MAASRTISGLLFPVSLKPVGDHISTRSAARKRNDHRAAICAVKGAVSRPLFAKEGCPQGNVSRETSMGNCTLAHEGNLSAKL